MSSLVRRADALLLVVDPSHPDALDDIAFIIRRLERSKVHMEGFFGHPDEGDASALTEGELSDEQLLERLEPGVVRLPAILVATKQDLPPRAEDTEALVELLEAQFPIARTSVETREGLGELAARVFDMLGVVRVYTKPPNKEANLDEPSILPRGSTLEDLARSIHKDLARYLTFARIWGEGYHDGQRIGRENRLEDGDIVEIHD
jgi:ribosome-interacting GTPase 1